MKEIPLQVQGEDFEGRKIRPDAGRRFVRNLTHSLRDAARFRVLHTSRVIGRPIRPLQSAWKINQLPWTEGSNGTTQFVFEAPTLGDAAPSLFHQGSLFDEDRLSPDWTVFDLLGQTIDDICRRETNDIGADFGVLESIYAFTKSDHDLVAKFAFDDGQPNGVARIDQALANKASDALAVIPPPNRVRVVGKIDMLKLSNHLFQVQLEDGSLLRGVWAGLESQIIDAMKFPQVVIDGMANYRANGDLLVLQAEVIREATVADKAFSKRPVAKSAALRLQLSQPRPGALESIVGRWPGDETDEEIEEFLATIS